MLRVGFFTNQLSLRGTEAAIYSYADYNETMLNNTSIIISYKLTEETEDINKQSYARFQDRFPHCYLLTNGESIQDRLDELVKEHNIDVLYIAKWGIVTPVMTSTCPTIVHAIFKMCQPHGTLYLGVSEYTARKSGFPESQCLPNIVSVFDTEDNAREMFGIPKDAFVVGRHGGYTTFDIDFVKQTVVAFAKKRPDVYFCFLNTKSFGPPLPNILFIEGTSDPKEKRRFLNTCDVMLHGRSEGESSSLACAEFSILNKPVITTTTGDLAHIEYLTRDGNACFVYTSAEQLEQFLHTLSSNQGRQYIADGNWNGYDCLRAEKIMPIFNKWLHKAIELFNLKT